MWEKFKGLIMEEDTKSPASKPTSSAVPLGQATEPAPAPTASADNQYVAALRTALKNRPSAFTALLQAAERLMGIIPDPTMRLKAAFATVSGEGRGVKEVMGAIEIHSADLESAKLNFAEALKREKAKVNGALESELTSLQATNRANQQQLESLLAQIQSLKEAIARNDGRMTEIGGLTTSENNRLASNAEQFELALTVVRGELDAQRALIQSALS